MSWFNGTCAVSLVSPTWLIITVHYYLGPQISPTIATNTSRPMDFHTLAVTCRESKLIFLCLTRIDIISALCRVATCARYWVWTWDRDIRNRIDGFNTVWVEVGPGSGNWNFRCTLPRVALVLGIGWWSSNFQTIHIGSWEWHGQSKSWPLNF